MEMSYETLNETFKIPIKDVVDVLGRGQMVVCELPDELIEEKQDFIKDSKIKPGAAVIIDNEAYSIRSFEKFSSSKTIAFKLDKELNI